MSDECPNLLISRYESLRSVGCRATKTRIADPDNVGINTPKRNDIGHRLWSQLTNVGRYRATTRVSLVQFGR